MLSHTLLKMTLVGGFLLTPWLHAADDASVIPVPSQILSAKKVFISNASDDCIALDQFGTGCTPGAYYKEFYSAIKEWGQFELTSSPADADLVLELNHSLIWTGSTDERYRLTIIDAHTHFTLWSFLVVPRGSSRVPVAKKNDGLARAQIVTDLKLLLEPQK